MFGLYGPGSARDHACMLRLVKENDGRDVRFYHCGANAVLSREPWCVAVPGNSPAEAAKRAREDGTKFVLITDSELLLAGAADAFRQEGVGALQEGGLAVAGGRVAAPIANAKAIEDVKQQVYGTLSRIRCEGKHHRSDLGYGIAEGLFS